MLELKHIYKTFNKGTINEKVVFEDLNLKVEDGDFITVIGSNGAGKSTMFNVIGGTFFPDMGEIILDNENITLVEPHVRSRDIGRLFQDPKLGTASSMTIEENLALACQSGGWLAMPSKQDKQRFVEALKTLDMGLEDRMKKPVGLLSGGQRQALTLLMATMNPPKILLLDEHTAALDPKTASKVIEITNNIVKKNHITCMMVTHNMQMALEMGNRTIMMQNGKIVVDIKGKEREKLTVNDLVNLFQEASGKQFNNDRVLLSSNE